MVDADTFLTTLYTSWWTIPAGPSRKKSAVVVPDPMRP